MANQTLTAMYDDYDKAADAVRQLESAGIAHTDISIVSNDATHQKHYEDPIPSEDGAATGTGTGTGASLGTLLGGGAGLLAGLGMLAIPGLGPVVAAGWLASTLVGAGVGAAAGGVIGALTGAGISLEHATTYAEGIRRGGTLVTVRVDEAMASRATEILDRDGSVDMDRREATWRQEGWTTPTMASGLGVPEAGLGAPGVAPADAPQTRGSGVDDLAPARADGFGTAEATDRGPGGSRVRAYPQE